MESNEENVDMKDNNLDKKVVKRKSIDWKKTLCQDIRFKNCFEKYKLDVDFLDMMEFFVIQLMGKEKLIKIPKKKKLICFRCLQEGHKAKFCVNNVVCRICKGAHFAKDCNENICKKCGKRHKKDQCKMENTFCKWCKKWNAGHDSKKCPYGPVLKRINKLEKISFKRRPRSASKTRFKSNFRKFSKKSRK